MFGNKFKYTTQLNFEKLEQRIELINDSISKFDTALRVQQVLIKNLSDENKKLREDINVLTKITEGNLGEAEQCEFLMLKTYRKDPVIFKDGKLVSTNDMTSSYIHWDKGEKISVEINS